MWLANSAGNTQLVCCLTCFKVCDKRLANWTAITTPLTFNGFQVIQGMILTPANWSNLAWNSSSSLENFLCILPLCGLQIASARSIRFHTDIEKMTACFWPYVSLKNYNFVREINNLTWALVHHSFYQIEQTPWQLALRTRVSTLIMKLTLKMKQQLYQFEILLLS